MSEMFGIIRKNLKRILLLAVLCLAVAAGGAFADAKNTSAAGATLTVWFDSKPAENAELRSVAAEFAAETGISVTVVDRRSVFDAPKDFVNNAETRDRPDLVYMQATDIGSLAVSGYLEPLEIIADITSRYDPTALEAFTLNGKTYGIGYSVDTSGLLYNKDLISEEELPQTWDEFWETAEALNVKSGGKYTRRGTMLNPKDMWFNYPIMEEYGAYYYGKNPDGTFNPYDVGLDGTGMLNYVAKMKEAMTKGLTIETETATESHISSDFAEGKVAMIFRGLWDAAIYQNKGLNYGIANLPLHSDGGQSKPFCTVLGFTVNAFSEHKTEAMRFYEYIYSDSVQQRLTEAGNGGAAKRGERNPGNLAVRQSDYIQSDPILKSLSEIISQPFPNIPEGTIWYNYATTSLKLVFFGDGGKPVDARTALKEFADLIRKDVAAMNNIAEALDLGIWLYVIIGGAALLVISGVLTYIIVKYRRAKHKNELSRIRLKLTPVAWALVTPFILLLLIFYMFPILHNIYLSLTNYSGTNLRDYGIIGFGNFKTIFVEQFGGLVALVVWTFVFAISVVALSFLLGSVLTMLLDRLNLKIAKIYRLIYILPWVIPTMITLLMWKGMLDTDTGIINELFKARIPWLSHKWLARVTTIAVMVTISFPYFMVVSFGFVKSIPGDYFEAAKLEGASRFYMFRKITLPILFNAMKPTLLMSFLMQFNQFGVYLLTEGGPHSSPTLPGATDLLITYVFNLAFNTQRYSLAAAYSVVIFIFMAIFALVSMKLGLNGMERKKRSKTYYVPDKVKEVRNVKG